MNPLQKLFLDELADVLHVENMLIKALPKMSLAAFSPDLKDLFEQHLAETKRHVGRLETVFKCFEEPAREKKCEGMIGLLVEGQQLLLRWKKSAVLDAALLCAARKIESFETVAYTSLADWAGVLKEQKAMDLLLETLEDEKLMHKQLTQLAAKTLKMNGKDLTTLL